jgi:hypothetical protein
MSTFCGGTGSPPSIATSDLLTPYTASTSILPASAVPADSSGVMSSSEMSAHMRYLEQNTILPIPPTSLSVTTTSLTSSPDTNNAVTGYVTKEAELIKNIKKEYCWYETRYYTALKNLLDSISKSSLSTDAASQAAAQTLIQSQLTTVTVLNNKCNLIIQITNGISKYRYTQSHGYQTQINNLNTTLSQRGSQLQAQADIFKSQTALADVRKRMVDYTEEKNKSNQNLLALYGFLNLIALGIIVYVAKD